MTSLRWPIALALVALAAPARAEISWRTTALEPVLAEAQQQHRLVLVDFSAVWCAPCQTMDAMVWNRADVEHATLARYVPFRVDADTTVGTALRERYHVGALPTVLALHADGTEIDRLTGEADTATVLAALEAWHRGESSLSVLAARLQTRPDDLSLALDVARRYAEQGDAAHARPLLEHLVAADPQDAHAMASRALRVWGDDLFLRAMHDPAQAVAPLQQLVTRFPTSDAASGARVPLATALHRTGHDAEALAVVTPWLEEASRITRPSRANSVAWMMFHEGWDLPRAEAIARDGIAADHRGDHALLDTLAEIVFARGRAAEAVRLEEGAARLDPGRAYYMQQIARFRAGASSATPASSAAPVSSRTPPHARNP